MSVQPYYYWSSSTYARDAFNAWVVDIFDCTVNFDVKVSYKLYFYPVRAGQ